MNKEWSRRDFMKSGVAAASLSLVGLLAESKARAEGYGDYGSSEGGAKTNRIKDPANLTLSEKKHSPFIQVDGPIKAGEPVKVTVSVGRLMHPMEAKHWIKWIELYAGENKIARVDLEPEVSRPVVTFMVVLSGPTTLKALEECNLHGIWEESLQV
ncbi:MAG: class II SORL domain-containing protein [candidate division NC10 bacterium]|nr:class II SORL domain-containing protein [candidate division NC10 bacterium]